MSKIIYTTENENERPKQTNADTAPPLNLVYGQEDTNTRPKRRTVLQHYLEENSYYVYDSESRKTFAETVTGSLITEDFTTDWLLNAAQSQGESPFFGECYSVEQAQTPVLLSIDYDGDKSYYSLSLILRYIGSQPSTTVEMVLTYNDGSDNVEHNFNFEVNNGEDREVNIDLTALGITPVSFVNILLTPDLVEYDIFRLCDITGVRMSG